jgi:hypothetical protein
MTTLTRFLVVIALAAANSAALAEWVEVNKQENITLYADTKMIRENNLVKVWVLYDSSTPVLVANTKPFLSAKTLFQYDCVKKLSRIIALYQFEKNMGFGVNVASDTIPDDKWKDIPPETVDEWIFERVACKKAK